MATKTMGRAEATETAEPPPADLRPTALLWATTYVPFGLALVFVLLYAELTQDLRLFRAIYTVRLAMVVSIVALVLFPHRRRSPILLNVWRLAWTFGLLAYAVHFLYGWFGVFGGQVATAGDFPAAYGLPAGSRPTTMDLVLQHQGAFVLYSNLLVTAVWALDVLLAWAAERARGSLGGVIGFIHVVAWLHVLASFGVATLLFAKNPVASALGYTMAATVGLSALTWTIGRLPPRRRLDVA